VVFALGGVFQVFVSINNNYRYTWGTSPTRRQFTGQVNETSIGLYFFNARWYDSSLSRFAQADTIIPGAGEVQAWDRYAAMANNPIRFVDPTGHMIAQALLAGDGNVIDFDEMVSLYGVNFKGKWNLTQKAYVMLGVDSAGHALSSQKRGATSAQAFRSTYGVTNSSQFTFEMGSCGSRNGKGGCGNPSTGAYTWGSREVEFAENSPFTSPGLYRSARTASAISINTVVHELGHAFAARFKSDSPLNPYTMVESNPKLLNPYGYAEEGTGEQGLWRPNTSIEPHETFANMFLGWTYDKWGNDGYGTGRSQYMITNMSGWISEIADR
jgi:RHS repeat-associated protein